MNLASDPFWSLPGPSRWLGRTVDKAVNAGLVGLSLPFDRGPPRLMEAIKEALFRRDILRIHEVRSKPERRAIVSRLASSAGMSGAAFRTLEGFLEAPETSGAAFVVEDVVPDEWMQLANFLKLFVRARETAQIPLAPLVIVKVPPDLPKADVAFTFGKLESAWIGVVSSFDMRAFVRDRTGEDGSFAARIREETIVELAGYDVSFAQFLCDAAAHDILDPISLLQRVESAELLPPRWGSGLVDELDGERFEHTLSAVRRNDWKLLERRVWRAHVKVLMALIADVRSRYYRLYGEILAQHLPLDVSVGKYNKTITDIHDLELSHMINILNKKCDHEEWILLSILNLARNEVAHFDPLAPGRIRLLSEKWNMIKTAKTDNSWRWPRCDQRLILLIGPSRAGKSAHAKRSYGADEIISLDALRVELTGSIRTVGGQENILAEARRRIHQRLSRGENAVVDAAFLMKRDRLAIVSAVPDDIAVVYEVIDRPLEDKLQNADVRTRGLVQGQADVFGGEILNILKGDGRKNTTVTDLRITATPSLVAAK